MLGRRPRDSYILATKVFFPMSETDRGLSRAQILKQIDASLTRLRTDYVDLYQCHRYDPETPLEETMQALSEVVRSGKARYIGFSEWSPEQIEAAFALPGVERFVSSQPQYSLLHRRPEAKVIPLSAANGVSQIVWSPLAQGVLTGKYRPGARPPADSRAVSESMGSMMQSWLQPDILEAVQKLKPLARRPAARSASSRWPGCCGSPTSPRPSSGRAGPSSWRRTPRPRGWRSIRRCSPRRRRSSPACGARPRTWAACRRTGRPSARPFRCRR